MTEVRAVAINVGANTNEPGFRGPIRPDGSFAFLPIPESAPTAEPVPTYGDIAPHVDATIPDAIHDDAVHLDPEFPEYPCGTAYTYGDEHGVKARPLSSLSAGDRIYFYATLSVEEPVCGSVDEPTAEPVDWLPPDWGAFVIGHFTLARDPLEPDGHESLSATEREVFASNAHLKRDPMDARVLLEGDPEESALYDRAVPVSRPEGGATPGPIVTELSDDSGKGPWWRRPLRFDATAADRLADRIATVRRGDNYHG